MGSVYLADDPQLGRTVAVKIPHFSLPLPARAMVHQRFEEAESSRVTARRLRRAIKTAAWPASSAAEGGLLQDADYFVETKTHVISPV